MNPTDHISRGISCDLCGAYYADSGKLVAKGRQDLLGSSTPLSTMLCTNCRFIFQPERFSESLLSALYEKDTSFAFGDAAGDLAKIEAGLAERQAVISNAMAAHGLTAGASVLDVGGGRGECCRHLVPLHRVVVADTTEAPPVDPRIEKLPGLFSDSLGQGTFDVVVMNHVLEHVYSPTDLLLRAHAALKPNGILVAEVPFELYTPLVFKHLGDWRHIAYFCRATLGQFLEVTGFAVERLVLEDGCYGTRRLPVIRAVGRKVDLAAPAKAVRNSSLVLLTDMSQPVVLASLLQRVVSRR